MIMQEYCKTRHITGKETKICRYLPTKVSLILLGYLSAVRPLETALACLGEEEGKQAEINGSKGFLFTKRGIRMTAEQIRLAFANCLKEFKINLNISGYR